MGFNDVSRGAVAKTSDVSGMPVRVTRAEAPVLRNDSTEDPLDPVDGRADSVEANDIVNGVPEEALAALAVVGTDGLEAEELGVENDGALDAFTLAVSLKL